MLLIHKGLYIINIAPFHPRGVAGGREHRGVADRLG
jgi:hypothetical protein